MTQQGPGALPRSNTDLLRAALAPLVPHWQQHRPQRRAKRVEEGRRAVELLPWLACSEKGTCLRAQLSTAHGNSTPTIIITPTHAHNGFQLKKEEGQLVTVAEEHQDGFSIALMRGVKFIISLILFVK